MILKQVNAKYVITNSLIKYHKFLEINGFDMDEYQYTRDVYDLISIDKCEVILLFDWEHREDYEVIRKQLKVLHILGRIKVVRRSCAYKIGSVLNARAQREYDQACAEKENG
jgi:L-rhamnose isomerase